MVNVGKPERESDGQLPLSATQAAHKDVKEFPLTSLRMPITGMQLSESNNNKLHQTTSAPH